MRRIALAVAGMVLGTMPIAYGADLGLERRTANVERGSYYRIRGAYQDSGWAYEIPVYHDCRVRIIQTPRGIDRIRRCL